jgi:hypothetical protein
MKRAIVDQIFDTAMSPSELRDEGPSFASFRARHASLSDEAAPITDRRKREIGE